MQTLGERLEEARKRKGLSIREAAEATKIRGDYLQKFEANTFDLDLPPLYIRGFVRAYARYLDFDPQRFLAEYDALQSGEGRPSRRESRENYGRVEFGGDGGGATAGPAGIDPVLLKYGIYGGGALVLIIVAILLYNLFSTRTEPRAASRPAAESAATTPAADATAQTLTFTALDETRIKIVNDTDKTTLYDGSLGRGQTRTFRKTGVLLITVEDRTKLRMEVNGRAVDIPTFPRVATAEDVTAGRARNVGEVLGVGNYGRFRLD